MHAIVLLFSDFGVEYNYLRLGGRVWKEQESNSRSETLQ